MSKRTVTLNMKRHNAPDKAFILVFSHFIVVFSIEHISVQWMLRMSTHIMVCVCHLKTKYPFEVTYPSVGILPGLSVWSLHVLPMCVCVCVCVCGVCMFSVCVCVCVCVCGVCAR